MNVISLAIWTLEKNCFIVYSGLIVCFIAFTLYHKNKLEVYYSETAKKEKLARTGTGGKARDFPDDADDDPDLLVPAIPEDTPQIPYRPPTRSDDEVLERSREYYELMAERRTVRSFSPEPIPQEVLDNLIKTADIMKMIRINRFLHIYGLILIIIVYAIIITVYNEERFGKQKRKNEVASYNGSSGNIILSEHSNTEKQIQIKRSYGTKCIKAHIKRINLSQTVYNLFLGPINRRSNVIVIQVHSNVFYLSQLLESMKSAHGITNSLLIFSHDYWDDEINKLVRTIGFAKYIQIFYPYSLQLYPDVFPGEDSKLCTEDSVCKNSTLRDPKASQAKLHWWWLANQVFDNMPITSNYDSDILFLEEGNYVTTDFLYMYRSLQDAKKIHCPYCELVSLAAHKRLGTYQYSKSQDTAVVEVWTDAMPKTGLAFNREIWKAVKSWSKDFCYYNDSRWDRSLKNLKNRKRNGNMFVISIKGPRVFILDECDKAFGCNTLMELRKFIQAISKDLFPRSLTVGLRKEREINTTEPIDGWLDIRDQKLCMHFTKRSLWY